MIQVFTLKADPQVVAYPFDGNIFRCSTVYIFG